MIAVTESEAPESHVIPVRLSGETVAFLEDIAGFALTDAPTVAAVLLGYHVRTMGAADADAPPGETYTVAVTIPDADAQP